MKKETLVAIPQRTFKEKRDLIFHYANQADNPYKTPQEEMLKHLQSLNFFQEGYLLFKNSDLRTLITIFSKSLFSSQTELQVKLQLSDEIIKSLNISDACFLKKHLLNALSNIDETEEVFLIDLNIIRIDLDNHLISFDIPEVKLYGLLD